MKFTLTYDGDLGSPDKRRIWEMRKHFHPQLEELWRIDPALKDVEVHRMAPTGNFFSISSHHSVETPPPNWAGDKIDLCKSIARGGYNFRPLVRETYLLTCSLKVIFLRKGEPGRVLQQGDLDNRMNSLFDALSMPAHDAQVVPDDDQMPDPLFTLMEDDALVTGISVETHRLLTPSNDRNPARLIIEVDVRAARPKPYNQPFS